MLRSNEITLSSNNRNSYWDIKIWKCKRIKILGIDLSPSNKNKALWSRSLHIARGSFILLKSQTRGFLTKVTTTSRKWVLFDNTLTFCSFKMQTFKKSLTNLCALRSYWRVDWIGKHECSIFRSGLTKRFESQNFMLLDLSPQLKEDLLLQLLVQSFRIHVPWLTN